MKSNMPALSLNQINKNKVFRAQLPPSTRAHTSCDQKRKIEQLWWT